MESLGYKIALDLRELVTPPPTGIYRCKFFYDAAGYHIEFHPYAPGKITTLRLIFDDTLHYSLKYTDRNELNTLYDQRGKCDDILIVQHGLLTDTSIANIALYLNGQWLTPRTPLLAGTTRARLIDEGVLFPADLSINDLSKARKIALMNAMVGFVEIENGIIS